VPTDVFGALANPTRRQIIAILAEGPIHVSALAERFGVGRPAISEHLKVLRDHGLVVEEKRGRERYYALDGRPLREVAEWLHPYERFWRGKLADLRRVLEEDPR
jgi:DNA-binding transcriptional ArsR family regulator